MICILHAQGRVILCLPLTLEKKLIYRVLYRAVVQQLKKNSFASLTSGCGFFHHPLIILRPDYFLASIFVIASWDSKSCCDNTRPVGSLFKNLSPWSICKWLQTKYIFSASAPPSAPTHQEVVWNDHFCFDKTCGTILNSSNSFCKHLLNTYYVPGWEAPRDE